MFAGPAAGKVVVQKEVTPPAGPGRRPQRQVVIERYDLVNDLRTAAYTVAMRRILEARRLRGLYA